jgi:hypothetical protein
MPDVGQLRRRPLRADPEVVADRCLDTKMLGTNPAKIPGIATYSVELP